MKLTFWNNLTLIMIVSIILAACSVPPAPAPEQPDTAPTQPPAATQPVDLPAPTNPPPTPTTAPARLWMDTSVPAALHDALTLPAGVEPAAGPDDASMILAAQPEDGPTRWVYTLVAAFPTITDEVPLVDLLDAWRGRDVGKYGGAPLRMEAGTQAAFAARWGLPARGAVEVVQPGEMLDLAWQQPGALFLIPFEQLEPRWKVLRVNGLSPLDRDFEPAGYPLAVSFGIAGDGDTQTIDLPATNRDPEKLTVILMTGVTALVRATGFKMEQMGMTFPGKDVLPWFQSADIRHISNEIAFSPDCPPANPYYTSLIFCSKPEYAELLDYVGANVIEMTGNHQMDWGYKAFNYTLDLYKERGMPYYAAGTNELDARKPLLLEDHGNKIAFIGCNPSGPDAVWATEINPGVANCLDFEWMKTEIRRLRDEGYLPIATMQYFEYYTPDPRPWQVEDFHGLADAGAIIVSGSQAHKPQAFDFPGDSFIHYGVGNLFFDQMDIPVVGTRQEFLDRHVIYDGKYISTELLTAMLEDYARPRPMTLDERVPLLQQMFIESGWLPRPQ